MNDLKFELSIQIQQHKHDENWSINVIIHDTTIYDKKFFIDNYPISSCYEEGIKLEYQQFYFNQSLMKDIFSLLLDSKKNYRTVDSLNAIDYYHFLSYEGFSFNVHPVSMSRDFLRMQFIGTQEEIYNKCKHLNDRWIKRWNENIKSKTQKD